MNDDTGTDWTALADRYKARAVDAETEAVSELMDPWHDDPTNRLRGRAEALAQELRDEAADHKLAAVGLRRLAQLDTAIGDPMSAPDELRQLADRLERWDTMNDDELATMLEDSTPIDDNLDAVVALRHHANLLDAIQRVPGESVTQWTNRIAAAVSPPPAPTTCPTEPMPWTCHTCGMERDNPDACPDSWHQAAT